MNTGDWVEKIGGDYDLGRTGVVLKVEDNGIGTIIVTVFSGNEIKSWAGHLVRVIGKAPGDQINENR